MEAGAAARPPLVVDVPPGSPGAALRVAGMSVLERILRERSRAGYREAIVRADREQLPELPDLPLVVTVADRDSAVPDGAERIAGDELLGVIIDRPSVARRVEWSLLQTCRRPFDGPGDRYVIRSLSLRVTRLLSRFPISPNHVTVVALLVGLVACYLLATADTAGIVLAGALLIAQVVLDSVDGELARIRHMGSKLGQWLDNLSDDVVDNLIVLCLGIGLGGGAFWLGLVAAVGRGFSAFVTHMGAAARGHPGDVMAFRWWFESDAESPEQAYDQPVSFVSMFRALGRRDSYMLVYGGFCLLGMPAGALALGVINGFVYTALAVVHLVKRGGKF